MPSDEYIYIYIIRQRSMTPQHNEYNAKSLEVVQSLHVDSKQSLSGTHKKNHAKIVYSYVPDEGSLLPKYNLTALRETYTYICIQGGPKVGIQLIYIYIILTVTLLMAHPVYMYIRTHIHYEL